MVQYLRSTSAVMLQMMRDVTPTTSRGDGGPSVNTLANTYSGEVPVGRETQGQPRNKQLCH